MTDDKTYQLSRRSVLAGLGTIGVASAGAGLGTSAFFSDTESFTDNRLVAGTLDLKVDWEEHYSFPQIYGADDPTADLDVTRSEPSDTSGYTALPDSQDPMVWVANEDLAAYMANTSIEAYPDANNDGQQDSLDGDQPFDFCANGADLDQDLDPAGLRTDNDDTAGSAPLVNLTDVKPGDFGELTLSMHLCDNPGYIWMNGGLVSADENGVTEPEGVAAGEGNGVELLDAIQTVGWYDGNCDNILGAGDDQVTEGEEADVVIVLDRSGSMDGEIGQAEAGANALVDALGPNDQVGVVSFSSDISSPTDSSTLDIGLTTDHTSVKSTISAGGTGGSTNMEAGVERAHEELLTGDQFSEYGESGGARSGVRKIMVVLGDGSPYDGTDVTDSDNLQPTQEATNAKNDGIEIFTIAYGSGGPVTLLNDMASSPSGDHAFVADTSTIETVFQQIGSVVSSGGEEVFHRGTLRDLLNKLEAGNGIPLDADPSSEGQDCFAALQTHCVGLAWWLPIDVGNEVQSDMVSFDVGFYTEQCRNNDGNGQPAQT